MSSIPRENQIEGTWEEILSRGREFAGKRVRLTVLSEEFAPDEDSRKLRDVADRLMAEVEKLEPDAARLCASRPSEGFRGWSCRETAASGHQIVIVKFVPFVEANLTE